MQLSEIERSRLVLVLVLVLGWADGQSEPQSANTEHEAAGSRTNGATLIRRKLPFGNGTFYEWIGPERPDICRYVLVKLKTLFYLLSDSCSCLYYE